VTLVPGERLIIDASVAVKWVVTETGSDLAEPLLERDLIAPDLLFAECANVLWKKVRRGELTREEAAVAAQTLEQADLAVVPTRAYVGAAAAIAIELDHPAYDAVYLAVAEAQGLRYVTADESLARKVRDRSSRFQGTLVLLADTA